MKLKVKNLTACATALEDIQDASEPQEVDLQDPKATLLNLRAAVSIALRLPIHGFWFYYPGKDKKIDFKEETKLLKDIGLAEGDAINVYSSKRTRESVIDNLDEVAIAPSMKKACPDPVEVDNAGKEGENKTEEEKEKEKENEKKDGANDTTAAQNPSDNDDEDLEFEYDLEDEEGAEVADMYEKLVDAYPKLKELREKFIEAPQEVMLTFQKDHPELFQLISKHQEAFLELMNSEELVESLVSGELVDPEEDYDEEELDHLNEMILDALRGNENGDGSDLQALLEGDDEDGDEDLGAEEGVVLGETDSKRILDFEPSEEDEAKIQQLVQLGFSYNQCKIAFYTCHKSIERAANMLFENPPQV